MVKIFAIIGAVLFGIIAVMTFMLALGFPLGEFTMGGKHKVIPKNMRILCLIMLVVQIFAIIIVLQTAGIIPLWFSIRVTKNICIGIAVYLSLNTIMNISSDSMKEKLLMTPLSIVGAICFWAAALNYLKE